MLVSSRLSGAADDSCALFEERYELADTPFDPLRMGPALIRRAEVRANRELLLELADRLRAGGPLGVEGLATTSLLVGDGLSPLVLPEGERLAYQASAMATMRLSRLERRPSLTDGNVGAT